MTTSNEPLQLGRYVLYDEIASGGMASVHLARVAGSAGFIRTVAIKRLHPHCAKNAEFVSMFIDEARLAARIKHPNVVPTLDVVRDGEELFIVMEYISGESLSRLLSGERRCGSVLSPRLSAPVVAQALHGLHAAHTATDEQGELLGIVHRDISPQNIIVSVDGIAHVLDFGVAKARGRLQTTQEGQIKGKLAYMPPEQLRGENVTTRSDIYAAGVVLWEALAGRRLFNQSNEGAIVGAVLKGTQIPPSHHNTGLAPDLDAIAMKALRIDPAERFQNARQMAAALEKAVHGASATEIGEWVQERASQSLMHRSERISQIESNNSRLPVSSKTPLGMPLIPIAEDAPTVDNRTPAEGAPATPSTTVPIEPHATTETSTALTAKSTSGRGHRKLKPLHGVVLGALITAIAMFAFQFSSNSDNSASTNATGSAALTAIPALTSATTQTTEPPAPPDPSAVASSSASAEPTTPPPKPIRTVRSTKTKKRKPHKARKSPPAKRKPGCVIRTVYDSKLGIKVPKKVCE